MKLSLSLTLLWLGLFFLLTPMFAWAGEEEAIKAAVYANSKAAQDKDEKMYLGTIDPTSPGFKETEAHMKQFFKQFSFTYELSDVKVIEIKGNEARVEFTQKATRVSGPELKNNVTRGIHTLKKSDGTWRIYSTELLERKDI